MQRRGYFMTQEAEDAAKWRMLTEYHQTIERLAALKSELKSLGESLEHFGRGLSNPEFRFVLDGDLLVGTREGTPDVPQIQTPVSALDAERVLKLLKNLAETEARSSELHQLLEEAGAFGY